MASTKQEELIKSAQLQAESYEQVRAGNSVAGV
jgi:hypothetical protein